MRRATLFSLGLGMCLIAAPVVADPPPHSHGGGDRDKDGKQGGETRVCVTFDDFQSDRVQSDLLGPYCHSKKDKIQAVIGQRGHLKLDTNSSNKTGVGRSLFVDFSNGPGPVPVTVGGESPGGLDFSSTDDLDAQGIAHDASMSVGVFRTDIDLRTMRMADPPRTDVNLRIALFLHPPNSNQEVGVFIRFDPGNLQRSCPPGPSSFVSVACVEEDAEGSCIVWTIDALDDIACVGLEGGGGGPHEFYSLPFSATIEVAP